MKLDTFINRPVLSTVISIFIVLLGLIGLVSLPVTQYPDIAPPTIQVSTTYQGANAQAVLNSVIAPLEESINAAEGMTYMESTATNTGSATINVYFRQGFDPNMAAVDVQNRVAKAQNLLPSEVLQVGVLTQKRQSSMLVGIALYDTSGNYDGEFLDNYAKINMIPELQRINGVGDVMSFGADYSMRVWLKPEVLAQYNLMPSDVASALAEQNLEAAPGAFGEQGNQSFQYTMRYKGRLSTPEEFDKIVVRALPKRRNTLPQGCCRRGAGTCDLRFLQLAQRLPLHDVYRVPDPWLQRYDHHQRLSRLRRQAERGTSQRSPDSRAS